jgi:hypothetical protein
VPAYIECYKLGIQKLENIAKKPQNQLRTFWEKYDFESYVVIKSDNKEDKVYGTLWTMTKKDINYVKTWELIHMGWYNEVCVTAILKTKKKEKAVTEIIIDQPIDRIVDGKNYPTFLMNKKIILKHAKDVRQF